MDIVFNKFVEYGEIYGYCYGIVLDLIRRVVNFGKYCILNFNCEVCEFLISFYIDVYWFEVYL